MAAATPFSLENPLLRGLFFYMSLLVLKMMAMSFLTAVQRMKNKAFANPEDAGPQRAKVKTHEDVERVRRAHQNDLENILIFFVMSVIYLATNPNYFFAINLFRAFTAARFIHTFVYAMVVIPQPSRVLAFFAGYVITGYMAVMSILHFL